MREVGGHVAGHAKVERPGLQSRKLWSGTLPHDAVVMHWPAGNKPRDDGNDIDDHGECENPVPNPLVDRLHTLYQPPEHEEQADLDAPQRRPKHDVGGEDAPQHLRVLLREVWRRLHRALLEALEGVDLGENREVEARVGEVEDERRPAEVVVESEAVGSLPAHDDAGEDEGDGNDHARDDGARVHRAGNVAAAHVGWHDSAGPLLAVPSAGRCEGRRWEGLCSSLPKDIFEMTEGVKAIMDAQNFAFSVQQSKGIS
ncbi:hypothetical protein V498_10147, partial [Pseudogymnoascus sp. VKM F-4517 (FW-2822)]